MTETFPAEAVLLGFILGLLTCLLAAVWAETRHNWFQSRRVARYRALLDELSAALAQHMEHQRRFLKDMEQVEFIQAKRRAIERAPKATR